MKNTSDGLRKELEAAGASNSEVDELAGLANQLKRLKPHDNKSAKHLLRDRSGNKWRALIPLGLTSLAGLTIGMTLVIFSQPVLPGNWLYPVQKLSDNVSMSVNPAYRGTVMMKRAQEVKQLIAARAGSKLVLATLADYQTEAATYKSVSTNYAVFEYCKNNLQQAANNAPTPERQAIDKALISLKNV